ncbi:alkaline phosphatase family protein [Mesobacillus zeae]|uniref:Alkaline phosphatase family protein n=1 Tax=Mesobacillus zeae TaxID=1917180 RepID=A0A398BDW5_9BACI|nr:alkaline phosphatase family protein [Mesobacillus zeae]RID85763.1 alkaline phosphatase family protein [Mesobacillus zeae]
MHEKSSNTKPVILIIVDTLMDAPLKEAMQKGMAPAFQFLKKKGTYYPNLAAPFPTMSVNVDATLLTGTFCNEHNIPGLVWFNKKENRLVNYGTHYRELLKLGLRQAIEDLLFNMNEVHISRNVTTIHEDLENMGKVSASINALVYRGNSPHSFKLPRLLTWITKIRQNRLVQASKIFSYGRFSKLDPSSRYQHMWQKMGVNDASSVQQLTQLIQHKRLPSFSIVYFPELDQRIHKKGRMDLAGIQMADQQMQKILNLYGDWTNALEQNTWIVMGDNGQAWVHSKRSEAVIDLRRALNSYKIMRLRKGIKAEDQVILAVNDRMAYIYSLDLISTPLAKLAKKLQEEERIDIIAWKNANHIEVRSREKDGELRFCTNGKYTDQYGQSWSVEGNGDILNLTLEDEKINYGVYPDALARLYSSLYSHEGDFLIVSAKPGYEFVGEGSPVHLGGAGHGGLHEQDTLVPLIVAGTDSYPDQLRVVDMKKWILSLIN